MTATVTPQTDMVKLKDPAKRLDQYLWSLKFLSQFGIDRLTIVENSGYDFYSEAKKILGSTQFDFISYDEKDRNIPIALLESRMYTEFIRKSDNLNYKNEIIKITGRYSVTNLHNLFQRKSNIVFSFRPTLMQKKARLILTSLYQLDTIEFEHWVRFLQGENLFDGPLERHFANFINQRNLNSEYIPYPIIDGLSGTSGTPYSKMQKEKLRISLSKILPFGYSWESP